MSTPLENFLYPVELPEPYKRTKPMQVLALGPSRMGTESLRRALQILGYDHVYHGFDVMHGGPPVRKAWSELGRRKWGLTSDRQPVGREDLDRLLGHCEAVTDQPCACFALELIDAYPTAKVILNYRDVEPWYRSVQNTFVRFTRSAAYRYLAYFDTHLYWRKQSFEYYEYGFFQGSAERHAKRIYCEHRAMVRGAVPESRLLEWSIEDGWGPLCEFLGKPVPEEEFPSGNTPAELLKVSLEASAAGTRRAFVRIGVMVGVVVGGLAIAWRWNSRL